MGSFYLENQVNTTMFIYQSYPYNNRRIQFEEFDLLDMVFSQPKRTRRCQVTDRPLQFSVPTPFDLEAKDLKSKIKVADGTLEIMIDKEIDSYVMKNGWDGNKKTAFSLRRSFKLPQYILDSEKLQKEVRVKLKSNIITVTLPKENVESVNKKEGAEEKRAESNQEKKIGENIRVECSRIPIVLIE